MIFGSKLNIVKKFRRSLFEIIYTFLNSWKKLAYDGEKTRTYYGKLDFDLRYQRVYKFLANSVFLYFSKVKLVII